MNFINSYKYKILAIIFSIFPLSAHATSLEPELFLLASLIFGGGAIVLGFKTVT